MDFVKGESYRNILEIDLLASLAEILPMMTELAK